MATARRAALGPGADCDAFRRADVETRRPGRRRGSRSATHATRDPVRGAVFARPESVADGVVVGDGREEMVRHILWLRLAAHHPPPSEPVARKASSIRGESRCWSARKRAAPPEGTRLSPYLFELTAGPPSPQNRPMPPRGRLRRLAARKDLGRLSDPKGSRSTAEVFSLGA